MVTLRELYWAAGFLEGEGTFDGVHKGRNPRVSAWQVQKEPLERLQRTFGGTIRYIQRRNAPVTHQPAYAWHLTGVGARGLMMTLYSLMSPKRQVKIGAILGHWRSIESALSRIEKIRAQETCPHGHPWDEENTYVYPGSSLRQCKTCKRLSNQRTRRKTAALYQEQHAPQLEARRDWTATHCRKGHERTPENTYVSPQGRTHCRLCRRGNKQAYYRRAHPQPVGRPPAAACPQGHPYTEENTYIQPSNGARFCRACVAAHGRAYRVKMGLVRKM